MRPELAVTLVAGLFGLVPLMVQIATTRAQRRDRMTRLNQLQAELELLERLHTLQKEVSATDEATKPQTDLVIRDSITKLLEQYHNLSEIAPSAAAGGKPPPSRQLSFFRRAFLLYNPHTTSGWVLHTLFYMIGFIAVSATFLPGLGGILMQNVGGAVVFMAASVVIWGIPLLILQRYARRNAMRNAAQLEEPNA
jgi:hypothetical protein